MRGGAGRDGAARGGRRSARPSYLQRNLLFVLFGDHMSNVLVFIEQRDGKIRKSSLEALALGHSLSKKSGGALAAVIAGSGIGSLASELAAYGAAKVFVADKP